jgi:hypothetical protein
VELKGTITNFVNVSSFQVRGTLVDASTVSSSVTSALANGVYVDLLGTVSGNTIVASSFNSILSSVPSSSTVEYVGNIASNPAPTSTGFTITTQTGATVSFTLASNVGYENGNQSALVAGTRVNVEATYNGSTYTAYGVQFLQASGSNTQTGSSEVAGVVSNFKTTGCPSSATYCFEVNNVQITGTGTPPTINNGDNVDVRFNSSGGNSRSGAVQSGSKPTVED